MSVTKILGRVSQPTHDRISTTMDHVDVAAEDVANVLRSSADGLTMYARDRMDDALHEVKMVRINAEGMISAWTLAGGLACVLLACLVGRELGKLASDVFGAVDRAVGALTRE